ncbi:MAG: sugar phosphate isomerase/epimerase [Ruminococcaceae bacterium]|nr:sugar phosphate isomerase/epimerase [Oscillospiraceae bacterium]
MIKISGSTGFSLGLGLEPGEVYAELKKAGYDGIDYCLMGAYTSEMWHIPDTELKKMMDKPRELLEGVGLKVLQTHSPMDAYWQKAPETKFSRWNAQVQAIKAASFLGSPYVVIHPIIPPERIGKQGKEIAKEINMEFFSYLRPYLEEYNVMAAIENVFCQHPITQCLTETTCSKADELCDYIDTLGNDRFCACLDVGHAVLTRQDPVEMIYALGHRLRATHMHDNDYIHDCHYMPGLGKLDWWSIGKALNDIGYKDSFNYEADISYVELGRFQPKLSRYFLQVYANIAKAIISVK